MKPLGLSSYVALFLFLCLTGSGGAKTTTQPNIIFMLADDMSWGSGGWGSRDDSDLDFVTPHLNLMATKGIVMQQHYTQETCTPARASLMTGRYPFSIGMQYGGVEATVKWGLNMTETTMADVFQQNGYTTYMIGKWNLGHFSAKLLPTARGFDYFLAYQSGSMYYWSKKDPNSAKSCSSSTTSCEHDTLYYNSLTYGDGSCYSAYNKGDDRHDYSTFLFRDKAINVISNHDYDVAPLFMYLAWQAVHDPFEDFAFPNGVPKSYLEEPAMHGLIHKGVAGRKRRQYAMSLNILDSAVNDIVEAVENVGQSTYTYFVFTGDNGGCYSAGGRNGPLRGNKGTLWEGGTKVDAMIWSSKFQERQQGAKYSGLMHISDWFPTLLDAAGITYTPKSADYELDGVSHWSNLKGIDKTSTTQTLTSPRTVMLYNYYDKVEQNDGWGTTPVRAVRDNQYKLIETWDNTYGDWFFPEDTEDDDADLDSFGSCGQATSYKSGTFQQYLFDLVNDPYEETNLYGLEEYSSIQKDLYAHLDIFYAKSTIDYVSYSKNKAALKAFKKAGDTIVPWEKMSDEGSGVPEFKPNGCTSSLLGPEYDDDDKEDDDFVDTDPTLSPTVKPSTVVEVVDDGVVDEDEKHGDKKKKKKSKKNLRS